MKKNFTNQLPIIVYTVAFSLFFTFMAYPQGMGVNIAVPISLFHVYENTTSVSTTAGLTIEQAGTGDAVTQYKLTGGQTWVTGIDNSDADKFKISSTVDAGSTPRISVNTTGEVGIGTVTPGEKLEIAGNLLFSKETARTIKVAASTTASTNGANLTISAANAAGPTANGGSLNLEGSQGAGFGGVPGSVNINTKSILVAGTINLTTPACALGGGNINLSAGGSTVSPFSGADINISAGGATDVVSKGGSITLTPGLGTLAGSQVKIAGGFATQRTATAADVTTANEVIVGVTNTAAARTITLADADKLDGRIIIIKDESGGATTNNITISPETGNIDGGASIVINTNYGSVRVYSNGTDWFTY